MEAIYIPVIVFLLGILPVIVAARHFPWQPKPVAQLAIVASLLLSWIGFALVCLFFLPDIGYFWLLRDKAKAEGKQKQSA